jgi:hypothetical protein
MLLTDAAKLEISAGSPAPPRAGPVKVEDELEFDSEDISIVFKINLHYL